LIGVSARAVYNSPTTAAVVSTATLTDAVNRWGEWVSLALPIPAAIAAFILTLVLIAKHVKGFKIQTLQEQNERIERDNSKLINQKLQFELEELKKKVDG
jgi:hypothetical protein